MTIVAAVVFVLGAAGSAVAPGAAALIGARVVLGLTVGASTVIVPTYIAEIAPAEIRGTLAALFQLAITIGSYSLT